MTADFAYSIMREFMGNHDTREVLAAKVPDLCPDCNGDPDGLYPKRFPDGGRASWPCDHRHAPSVGKLLAIGAAVMTANIEEADQDGLQGVFINADSPIQMTVWRDAGHLLTELRTVGDD